MRRGDFVRPLFQASKNFHGPLFCFMQSIISTSFIFLFELLSRTFHLNLNSFLYSPSHSCSYHFRVLPEQRGYCNKRRGQCSSKTQKRPQPHPPPKLRRTSRHQRSQAPILRDPKASSCTSLIVSRSPVGHRLMCRNISGIFTMLIKKWGSCVATYLAQQYRGFLVNTKDAINQVSINIYICLYMSI